MNFDKEQNANRRTVGWDKEREQAGKSKFEPAYRPTEPVHFQPYEPPNDVDKEEVEPIDSQLVKPTAEQLTSGTTHSHSPHTDDLYKVPFLEKKGKVSRTLPSSVTQSPFKAVKSADALPPILKGRQRDEKDQHSLSEPASVSPVVEGKSTITHAASSLNSAKSNHSQGSTINPVEGSELQALTQRLYKDEDSFILFDNLGGKTTNVE